MRLSPLLVAAFLLPSLARASDSRSKAKASDRDPVECSVEAEGNDRVAKGHDVVVSAGEHVDNAVAVDANVIVRSGAHVKSALALHGSVTVEPGAELSGSVVAIGGKVQVAKEAHVSGGTLALDGREGLHLQGDDGKDLDVSLSFDGKSLAQEILEPLIAGIHRCKVTQTR